MVLVAVVVGDRQTEGERQTIRQTVCCSKFHKSLKLCSAEPARRYSKALEILKNFCTPKRQEPDTLAGIGLVMEKVIGRASAFAQNRQSF